MQKQLVALTLMWTAQVAPVAAALLAQASFVQEQGRGELDVEGADGSGILQTGSAFLARETAEGEADSEPPQNVVVVVKALATANEITRVHWSPQQKVKDIAAHCKKELPVPPFVEMKIFREGEAQALQPDAEVKPEVGQKEVGFRCYAQPSALNNLIRVAADNFTAPQTWSARTEDFAQQLAKDRRSSDVDRTTSLSDTYTDPFAKAFINAAEWLFDEMASTPADEDDPVPVRVASGLQSRVRQVEDAAFSEWEKEEKEKGTLQEGIDTEQQRTFKSHSNMAMVMFRGCMKKMRELSREYYKTSKVIPPYLMEMTAPHYRAYKSDDAPDSGYVYARNVEYVSRAVHFAPTEVLDALEGQPVPSEARVTLEFNYDAGTQPYTARPGRLRAIIVRGHPSRLTLTRHEDPGLGKWDAKNVRGSGSGNWAIVPFATGSEFTPVDPRPRFPWSLLPPAVNFMDIDEWVKKNEASLPVLGA